MQRDKITDKDLIRYLTGVEKLLLGGLSGLLILLVLSSVEILLSVAIYAATTTHRMSFVNYLYGNADDYYQHGVLKFFLFLEGSFSIVLLGVVVIAGMIYLMGKGRNIWAGSLLLFIVTLICLLFIPVSHKEKVYAIKVTVKTDSPIQLRGKQSFITKEFSSKSAVEQYFYNLNFSECLNQEMIVKTRKVRQPLLKLRFPQNPNLTNSESELYDDND